MELQLIRQTFTDVSTVGELLMGGIHECFVLEDLDRGLHKDMQLHILESMKVKGETAIPYGRYEIVIDVSARFKRLMPHILGVPAFDGIRIHSGNTESDTEGCPLVGRIKGMDFVGQSVLAFNEFFPKLKSALEHEQCFIEITKEMPKQVLA